MIYVASSQYNPQAKALEVYLSGCTHACLGCHNPEIQGFGIGKKWRRWFRDNKSKITPHNILVERVWLMGGDALCQDVLAYHEMMHDLQGTGIELWLWTGKKLTEIPKEYSVTDYFQYIKAGPYEAENTSPVAYCPPDFNFKIELAGNNQRLFKRNAEGVYDECPILIR